MGTGEGAPLASPIWTLNLPPDATPLGGACANHRQLTSRHICNTWLITAHSRLHLSSPPASPTTCLPATFSPHAKSITEASEDCQASPLVPPPLKPTSPPPFSKPDPSAHAQIHSGRTGRLALFSDSMAQPGINSWEHCTLRITMSGESPLKDSNNVYCAVTLGAPNSTLLMISLK